MPLELHDGAAFTAVMPRLFVDAFRVLPCGWLREGALSRLRGMPRPGASTGDRTNERAARRERVVQGSQFRPAHARMLDAKFPALEVSLASNVASGANKSHPRGALNQGCCLHHPRSLAAPRPPVKPWCGVIWCKRGGLLS
jgi:hypothetical protein